PVTYTIIFGNSGEVPAFELNLDSDLPAELVDIAVSSSQTITQTGTAPYSWALGTLAADSGGVITVTGRIDPDLNAELNLSNTVQIYSDNALAEHSVSADVVLPEVAFAVTSATVAETDGQVTLTLNLSNPNPYADITVYYATADGTALAGQDYVAANSSVILAPGQTQTTIQIVILHNVREEEPETFTVTLVAGGGVIPAGQITVTVTITDNDLTVYGPIVTRP
ncbi:MAG: hypothetical protein KDE09_25215, partial [Anaerolineales bacterium]|nr:hypothetical protein [Anaerolineales bacterium]